MSAPWLDIIIPLRNPGEPFLRSVESLVSQTHRSFGVLLSDNHSTSGSELLGEGVRLLQAAGIQTRVIRPPHPLGRVEHWNWAHHASEARWLKPLFVGDTLASEYVARLLELTSSRPSSRVVRCGFDVVTAEGTTPASEPPCKVDTLSPAEFLKYFPQHGNWLGGPVNIAYEKTAWCAAGGYPTQLPAVADMSLYVTLVLINGLDLMPESLAYFHLHDQRFSHGIRRRRVIGSLEVWLILRQARNYCLDAKLPWPENGVWDGTVRQLNIDYWMPLKKRIKEWIKPGA